MYVRTGVAKVNQYMFYTIERDERESRERTLKYERRKRAVSAFALYMRIFCGTLITLILLRLIVLTSEAHAMITGARMDNQELLRLCEDNIAVNSPHMRTACMQARIERASPAFVRAFTSATYAFCGEIYSIALAPLQAISVAGLLSLVSALPWFATIRNVFGMSRSVRSRVDPYEAALGNGSFAPEHAVLVLHNGERAQPLSAPSLSKRRALTTPPTLLDEDCI